MRVIVNEKYTYECPFLVEVGDRVKLPPGYKSEPWVGTVTSLGSSYRGEVKKVIGFEDCSRERIDCTGPRSIFDEWKPSAES